MARPKIKIDWEQFDKLCEIQATLREIASWFDCTVDTIENRVKQEKGMSFSEYFKQKGEKGKISIRRKQYETAMAGNIVMLIFLGKNMLGQTDKTESTIDLKTMTQEQREKEIERLSKLREERNGV